MVTDTHRASQLFHNGNGSGYPQLSRKFVARRISEGETGRLKEELKCQACGKGYKHVSSLAKHLWEHTPEWNVTSKLLISKHQQVQLLEAASILVSMNEEEEEQEEGENENENENENDIDNDTEENGHNFRSPSSSPNHDCSSQDPNSDSITESSSLRSSAEPEIQRKEEIVHDFLQEQLTPSRDIPITSAKPIFKTPSKNSQYSYHHSFHNRRQSLSHHAGSLGSVGSSVGRHRDSFLRQASPYSESILAKDISHNPPLRHRSHSTLHSFSASLHASRPSRDFAIEDEDELQDPHDDDEKKGGTHGDVFDNLEV